ncbi:DUF305 domain-containing protein [Hymenobacter latericus]|uniref:DUF305 domain-containing protein n=1 Tax=Hymenobacter sp. YIM 151858-1 TaxID=2987688 RepID=UPI002226108C|nr:DUF305 domain-containing protein [Hymenobacter sp. YIM 151858-1]UYZ59703.1 DUF305 domain-containing protein [Hymenobacter sp. YIM 151858-1]
MKSHYLLLATLATAVACTRTDQVRSTPDRVIDRDSVSASAAIAADTAAPVTASAAPTAAPAPASGKSTLNPAVVEAAASLTVALNNDARRLADVRTTGNADHDFAAMMAEHAVGAVDLARVQLRDGKSPELRRLAEQIVAERPAQAERLRVTAKRLAGARPTYNPQDATDPYKARLIGVMRIMKQPLVSSEKIDVDFARLLRIHTQSGIALTNAVVAHGRDAEVKKLAQRLASEQTASLAQLETWLQQNER